MPRNAQHKRNHARPAAGVERSLAARAPPLAHGAQGRHAPAVLLPAPQQRVSGVAGEGDAVLRYVARVVQRGGHLVAAAAERCEVQPGLHHRHEMHAVPTPRAAHSARTPRLSRSPPLEGAPLKPICGTKALLPIVYFVIGPDNRPAGVLRPRAANGGTTIDFYKAAAASPVRNAPRAPYVLPRFPVCFGYVNQSVHAMIRPYYSSARTRCGLIGWASASECAVVPDDQPSLSANNVDQRAIIHRLS